MIYDIADLRIDIRNEYPYTTRFCAAYLSADQAADADIVAVATAAELEEEQKHSPGFSIGYIENICLYRNLCLQLPKFNRMLLHAAVLEYDGNAYAFLGRSGTGKSTHTGLWLRSLSSAKIINGDKPILRIEGGDVFAYGTPWMGKEGRGFNSVAPLKGLCFLEQAKKNTIRPLSPTEIASRLFVQLLLPTDEVGATKTLELADSLVQSVSAWLLQCDISEEAVRCSFEAMTKQSFEKRKVREL